LPQDMMMPPPAPMPLDLGAPQAGVPVMPGEAPL